MNMSLITDESDVNLEKKENFFADYFNYLNKNLGLYSHLEFETPLSLCDKVVFQIENNPNHMIGYLDYYLKHIFFESGGFTNRFEYYKKLRPLIDEYIEKEKVSDKKEYIDTSNFLENLKNYIEELKTSQIEVVIELLYTMFHCQHTIEEHKDDITHLTQIIVSHLRFSDKKEKDIDKLIKSIMSQDKNDFPLPKLILSKRNGDNYDEIVDAFFENLDFLGQLRGIINFVENDDEWGYNLIRIFKLQLPVNKSINYGNVEILNPKNEKFDKIKTKIRGRERLEKVWHEFTETEGASVAVVKGLWNDERTLNKSIREVQRTVDHINNRLGLNAYLDPFEVRWTSNFEGMGYIQKYNKSSEELSKDDIGKLKGDNLFELLRDNPSNAANTLKSAEKFYNRALISNDVSDYWHYLECIIPLKKSSKEKVDKQVKSACASILMLNRKYKFHDIIAFYLYYFLDGTYNSSDDKRTENSFSRVESMIIRRNNSWNIAFEESASFEHHPIIKELREISEERDSNDNIKNEYKYFYGIFHELYEIRNTYIHRGITNKYAERKLSLIIPKFIRTIRGEILEEVKKHKQIEMESIIENIIKESEKYCPYKVNKNGELYHI